MPKPFISSLLLAAVLSVSLAQPAAACESAEADGLDFWVGAWDLAWDTAAGPGAGSGTHIITRDLGGCVVHERFADAAGFAGESVSVLTPQGWRQTWVDNAGGYLLFEGATDADGRVTEMRQAPFAHRQSQMQVNRMIWEDVTPDALTWRWQASADDGETWADRWVIRYTRAE